MKFLIIASILITAAVAHAQDSEVWYDASGNVVKVTAIEKGNKSWVPTWKKKAREREDSLAARRAGRLAPRASQSYHSIYRHDYGGRRSHYGYGQHSFYHQGYFGSPWRFNRGCYSPSRARFHGSYRGNGWSVRWGN